MLSGMSIEQLLHEYNPWWEAPVALEHIVKRDKLLAQLYPLAQSPEVILLTGLRRVGKTITLKCLVQYLIEQQQVNPKHCLYVSMDDYQLKNYTLNEVINSYRQLQRLSSKEIIYVFFDEITYIPDFQIQLKNLYDKGAVKCFASSSNSSLLKDDAALLSGRRRTIEVNPLSFDEYLTFKNITIKKSDQHLIEQYFQDYMQTGGMPEYVLREDREYLVNLIDDIIMKDIVAYHQLRNPQVIKDFFVLLMERAGKQISINKVANILGISPDTAKRYLNMFVETYLIHLVPRYGKTNETLVSAKKVYATDVGMRNIAVGFRDKGAIFENIVFMKIKDHQPRYVLTDGQELDFFYDNTLLEAKYLRDIEGKQKTAFEHFPAKKKVVIKNIAELESL